MRRSQSPPEIWKHCPICGHSRRSTYRKAQLGGRGKLATPRDLIVEKVAHILKGNERCEIIPKSMILKNL